MVEKYLYIYCTILVLQASYWDRIQSVGCIAWKQIKIFGNITISITLYYRHWIHQEPTGYRLPANHEYSRAKPQNSRSRISSKTDLAKIMNKYHKLRVFRSSQLAGTSLPGPSLQFFKLLQARKWQASIN